MAVYARWPGLQLVRDLGLEDIRDVDPPFATKDAFAYLHKRHAWLIPKASEALRAMKADGPYQRIYELQFLPQEAISTNGHEALEAGQRWRVEPAVSRAAGAE
ncbi:MAG: hypothetical protein IIC87_07000 [Chloroflexi bacterium]|nr:hypothetical protein [Chloroflexota bacterium]